MCIYICEGLNMVLIPWSSAYRSSRFPIASHSGGSLLLKMMKHEIMLKQASTIPSQILSVRYLNCLATTLVVMCQLGNEQGTFPLKVPNHFRTPFATEIAYSSFGAAGREAGTK